ncbi:MAG: type II toxin-antitoxin system Phd/YefM family antitoxin [Sphaerochaeta sp.]|jgi:prevent-host-death family protein
MKYTPLISLENALWRFVMVNELLSYHNHDNISQERNAMSKLIRPVSDIRNKFADISKTVHETQQPVILTKNGYADMVVMSIDAYEKHQFESEIFEKLLEAELEAKTTGTRYSLKDLKRSLEESVGETLDV